MQFIGQGIEQLGSSFGFIFLLSLMGVVAIHIVARECPLPSSLGDGEG